MAKKEELEASAASEKLKALQAAMAKIEKDFGKGSIMKLGDDKIENVGVIPTGSIALNAALGVGGYPKGRIIEIYGPESSGKTTLAIHAIAEAQKKGGIAAFIDAEHAFDRFYAKKLGVDIDNLLISQPDNGEQALEIADQLIRSSAVDVVVVDSVAALTPKAESFFSPFGVYVVVRNTFFPHLVFMSLTEALFFSISCLLCSVPSNHGYAAIIKIGRAHV